VMFALVLCFAVQTLAASNSAVYVQSNNPAGNQIYVYQVNDKDGTLWWSAAVDTQGTGGGTPHSQSALATSGNFLLAANGGDNSISLLWIDEKNASLVTYVDKITVQGTFPSTIAVTSSWNNVACVVTTTGNLTLSCYSFTKTKLTYLPAWTRDLGLWGNVTTPTFPTSQVAFSPNSRAILIQFKGLNVGALVFSIGTDGTLSQAPVTGWASVAPLGPASYGFQWYSPTTIVTTDAMQGILLYQLSDTWAFENTTGSFSSLNPAGTKAYCWAIWSPRTKDVYGMAAATSNVTEVAVGSDKTLTQKASVSVPEAGGLTDGIIVSEPDADWLYVLSSKMGITYWKITGVGQLSYTGSLWYPAGMYNSTMAGLVAKTITSVASSVVLSSFAIFLMFASIFVSTL